jgi:hypothetical protein
MSGNDNNRVNLNRRRVDRGNNNSDENRGDLNRRRANNGTNVLEATQTGISTSQNNTAGIVPTINQNDFAVVPNSKPINSSSKLPSDLLTFDLGINAQIDFINKSLGRTIGINKCESGNIVFQFIKYAELLCEKTPDAKKVNEYFILGSWLWIIFSCYNKIEYSSGYLKGNSSNAKFFKFQVYTEPTIPIPIFAKCQISDDSDNMIVDSLNGYLINQIITQNPLIKPHFMKYIESCFLPLTIVSGDVYCTFENIFLSKDSPSPDKNVLIGYLEGIDYGYDLYKTSFHHSIRNKFNLQTLISKTSIIDMPKIYKKLGNLFYSLQIMGRYGFCHNDAHGANVLLDEDSQELVLIDYGRSFFNGDLIGSKLNDDNIKKRIFYERGKHQDFVADKYRANYNNGICDNVGKKIVYDSYTKYISSFYEVNYRDCGLKDYITNPPNFNKENLFMFDIMTITLGVISSNKIEDIKAHYATSGKSLSVSRRESILDTMEMMSARPQDIVEDSWVILLPGLFWFSLFVEFIRFYNRERGFIIGGQGVHIIADTSYLFGLNAPLYKYFQLLNILHSVEFDNFCRDYCADDISYALEFFGKYKNAMNQQRAGKNKKMNKKNNNSKTKKTLGMEIKKVPKSTFKDYMGGYDGPDSEMSISNSKSQAQTQSKAQVRPGISRSPFGSFMNGYEGPNSDMSVPHLKKLPKKPQGQAQTQSNAKVQVRPGLTRSPFGSFMNGYEGPDSGMSISNLKKPRKNVIPK